MLPFFEIIIVTAVIVSASIILGIALIIVLAVTYYQLRKRQGRAQEISQQPRIQNSEVASCSNHKEIIAEEKNHSEAITHEGEAPPRYADAITSSDYQSISIEDLDQMNKKDQDKRESDTENSTDIQPPPYGRD